MKRIITLLLCLLWSDNLSATNIRPSDQVTISTRTIYNDGNLAAPDSVRIQVFRNGAEQSDAWYNNADAEAAEIDGWLHFHDQLSDIDGAGGDGHYTILGRAYDLDSTLYTPWVYNFTVGPWTAIDLIEDSIQAHDDWVAQEATLAYFDTLIYQGPRSLGIYIDSAAGNTNTVLGTDGTSKNPVSTIAAAKTLATALGYNRYYFLNASTFNDAANDLPSSHQNWEFIGIANGNALAFGTQRVDESRFENMNLSGTMHASGGNVLYTNCTLGYITANFNGHAFNCLLADTIVVKADVDIEFVRCQSDVGGNRTPTIDLSGGSSVVQVRAYSGGIRIMNGASNDTVSIETDGQVIIAANNTSLNITVRGMATLTNNGTTTNLTKDAVFSRQEADEWVWANADTAQPDSSDLGVWLVNNLSGAGSSNWTNAQRDSVLRNMEDRALSLVKFDSAFIALLTGGIWLYDGAANTNTTVGIDGTISNPVSTLAAARILADSQGLQKYYLINNSVLTLDATYEDWKFVGIGEGSLIDFGSQDVDNSHFEHLMISGTQGGTGVVGLHGCYLNTIDSLEAVVTNSSYSDTISLRASTNTVFDQCYSHIAGNASPGLDFNSAGTIINMEVRHYSGGLTLFNMTSDHTISYESDGQLVIDASCTGGYVTARGNLNITRNGTTTLLTDMAVFNVNAVAAYPEYAYKVVATGSPTTIAIPLSYISPTPGDEADDVFNGMIIMPITGNAAKQVRNIVDYTDADSTLTIRPGLTTAMNSGDTAIILPSRMAVEPNPLSNHEIAVTATGEVTADSVLKPQDSIAVNGIQAGVINSIAAYTQFIVKGTVEDSSGNTTIIFQTDLASSVNDLYNRQQIEFISGNNVGFVTQISDYVGATGVITVVPGLVSGGANGGDSIKITGSLIGLMANIPESILVNVSANNAVYSDTVLRPPQTMVAEDTVTTGDTLAVKKDSLIYQGAGSSAEGIKDAVWGQAADSAFAAGSMGDSAKGWGATGAGNLGDSTIARIDSILASTGDSLQTHVGRSGVSTTTVSLFMQHGDYIGGAGSPNNIKDHISSIGGGAGNRLCSLFVSNASGALGSGRVRMTSGATTYSKPISGDGFAVFNVDDATWTVLASVSGNTQDTIPQTIVITADVKDTVTMTAFTPSSPTDTGKVVLYVWTDRILGDTLEGATFRVIPLDKGKNWVTGGNRILALGETTKKTDSTGYAEIEVYQSSFVSPYPSGSDSLKYNISITYPGLSSWAQFRFVAPDSGNQYQIGVIE